jgi:hypothetical protein
VIWKGIKMIVTESTDAATDDHKMLWQWSDEHGWVTSDDDALLWNRDHAIRCWAITRPKLVAGKLVNGDRCKNVIRMGHPKWYIAPGSEVPRAICPAHKRDEDWIKLVSGINA